MSRLYRGTLYHRRHTPTQHSFQYSVFMPFVDLDALPELVAGIPFWSAQRFALAQFSRADFLGDPTRPLASEVRRRILEETGQSHEGKIFLLANWRYFGYQNNPIACYFCFDQQDQLRFVVAEVTNTPWGERHSYVLKAPPHNAPLAVDFDKAMHVSPFNPMNMTYRWRSTVPDETLAITLSNLEGNLEDHLLEDHLKGHLKDRKPIFDATLSLQAEPFTAKTLRSAILRFPFMTLKVGIGIYWQALKLWVKKTPLYSHPREG